MSAKDIPGSEGSMKIQKDIVETPGGKVWAKSTFGKGRGFYFTLPIVKS